MENGTKGQVENILAELGKKIDQLIVETKDASVDVRDEVESKIKDLKSKKEQIESDFNEYKDKNDGKWTEAKTHLSSALTEIKKAVDTVFKTEKTSE